MSAIEQIISALLNVDESPPSVTPIDNTREREKAQQEQMFFYNSHYGEEEEDGDDEGQENTGGTNDENDGL